MGCPIGQPAIFVMEKKRVVYFIEPYFRDFYRAQSATVQEKITWTIDLIKAVDRVPELYLKHLSGTKGIYEIRIQQGSDSFRIFCFFVNNTLVLGHGFQKKTGKTPRKEIERAEKIKQAYYEKNALN